MPRASAEGNARRTLDDAESVLHDLRKAGERMTAQDHREQTISYAASLASDDELDGRREVEQCLERMQGTLAK